MGRGYPEERGDGSGARSAGVHDSPHYRGACGGKGPSACFQGLRAAAATRQVAGMRRQAAQEGGAPRFAPPLRAAIPSPRGPSRGTWTAMASFDGVINAANALPVAGGPGAGRLFETYRPGAAAASTRGDPGTAAAAAPSAAASSSASASAAASSSAAAAGHRSRRRGAWPRRSVRVVGLGRRRRRRRLALGSGPADPGLREFAPRPRRRFRPPGLRP